MRFATTSLLLALAACGPATPERPEYQAGPPAAPSCVPNLDGRVDATEMTPALDLPASYLVTSGAVDVGGRVDDAGHRVWDWSAEPVPAPVKKLSGHALAGRWYAGTFPADAFAVPLDLAGSTEAIYRHDANALWMLGIVSAEESPATGRTSLVYDQPVALYRFPIEPGKSWSSTGVVRNGTLYGLPYAARDTYEGAVDGAGRLLLPDLTFTQAHRVRLRTTAAPVVGLPVVTRQVSFVFECFGEVARATSATDEPSADFTRAAEIRRLGL